MSQFFSVLQLWFCEDQTSTNPTVVDFCQDIWTDTDDDVIEPKKPTHKCPANHTPISGPNGEELCRDDIEYAEDLKLKEKEGDSIGDDDGVKRFVGRPEVDIPPWERDGGEGDEEFDGGQEGKGGEEDDNPKDENNEAHDNNNGNEEPEEEIPTPPSEGTLSLGGGGEEGFE